MLLRVFVFFSVTIIFALLPEGGFQSSRASIKDFHPDSLWSHWEDVSLQMLKTDRMESYFDRLHSTRRFNGAVYISEKGTTILEKSYGVANERTKEELTLHTPFQLASMSKIFTATAVMMLYQDGKLDFDDKVMDHIPGWPYETMTIRHLLNHRSGMARYMAVASWYWKDYKKPLSNQDVLNQYIRHKPVIFFTPGNGFNYCNTNYVILACLVEKISGQSFDEFMNARIFQPLCMNDAAIYSRVTEPEIPGKAIGYKPGKRGYYEARGDYIDGVFGDKGMYASVRDIEKFDRALYNHTLLFSETIEKAFKPGSRGRINNYGFGWRMKLWEDKVVYHFGWWRGFRTCYIRDLEKTNYYCGPLQPGPSGPVCRLLGCL